MTHLSRSGETATVEDGLVGKVTRSRPVCVHTGNVISSPLGPGPVNCLGKLSSYRRKVMRTRYQTARGRNSSDNASNVTATSSAGSLQH